MAKVSATQQLVGDIKTGIREKCSEPSKWLSAAPLKFDLKPLEAVFWANFSNLEKRRLEVADDIISDVAVE